MVIILADNHHGQYPDALGISGYHTSVPEVIVTTWFALGSFSHIHDSCCRLNGYMENDPHFTRLYINKSTFVHVYWPETVHSS